MRNIAIIGSGQAGLLAAHGLVKAGYKVTVYSDRTADQWLNESRPTGTAARFDISLAYERELGLNHWEKEAPKGEGVHLTFSPTKDNRLLTLAGRLENYFLAIDLRLQSHRWMNDFATKGGKVEIENVTVPRLDEIAAAHELTIVAAGRAELANLFERDAARSVYDKAQRNLTMIITTGGKMGFAGVPFLPVKFNFFAPFGEAFYVPYFHKDHGPTWNMLVEAKPGSPLDRFGDCKSGEQAVALYKQVIKEVIPWDYDWAKDMELADPHGWLVGRVAPTVRKPVGATAIGSYRYAAWRHFNGAGPDRRAGRQQRQQDGAQSRRIDNRAKGSAFRCAVDDGYVRAFLQSLWWHYLHLQQHSSRADHKRGQDALDRSIR
jgi:Styrene monooxygenase A putative substrate binding domain